jgi:hypothetical protein
MTRHAALEARSTTGHTMWRFMPAAPSPHHLAWRRLVSTSLSLFLLATLACSADRPTDPRPPAPPAPPAPPPPPPGGSIGGTYEMGSVEGKAMPARFETDAGPLQSER